MQTPKKYFIKTYGCAANVKDSQEILSLLDSLGVEETHTFERADVVILNSCSVRQAAEDKIYGFGKKFKELKKRKPLVILTGCMVGSAVGERKRYSLKYIKDKIPWVDVFLAPGEYGKLPSILKLSVISKITPHQPFSTDIGYINISTGCDNFCSYCVVPYSRGPEKSKTKEIILSEAKNLISKGYSHLMLVAQNVNSWGLGKEEKFSIRAGSNQKVPFAELLREVSNLEGIQKVSFMSSNPFDFTQDLIDTLKLPKVSRYLHIAVQSGDNEILKKMNRRHTVEEFMELIKKIKKAVPEIEIGTDLIVGFPGETEEQFLNTIKLCKKIKFNVAYVAKYSPRLGTSAQKSFVDDVPLKEKRRRHKLLTNVVLGTL